VQKAAHHRRRPQSLVALERDPHLLDAGEAWRNEGGTIPAFDSERNPPVVNARTKCVDRGAPRFESQVDLKTWVEKQLRDQGLDPDPDELDPDVFSALRTSLETRLRVETDRTAHHDVVPVARLSGPRPRVATPDVPQSRH
jgi:hypothetical protein